MNKSRWTAWTTGSIVVSLILIGVFLVIGFSFTPIGTTLLTLAGFVFAAGSFLYAHFQVNPLPTNPAHPTQPLAATYNKGRRRFWRTIGAATIVGIAGMIGAPTVLKSLSNPSDTALTPTPTPFGGTKPGPLSTLPSTQAVHTQAPASRELPVNVPFAVYTDYADATNQYTRFNPTGDGSATFNDNWTENPHQGTSCIQVVYPKNSNPNAWAGLDLQDPVSNWGTAPNAGYNLSRASRLSFWVRGHCGGERIAFQMGGVGYNDDGSRAPYADSLSVVKIKVDPSVKTLGRAVLRATFLLFLLQNSMLPSSEFNASMFQCGVSSRF
jgi:hypothetical protein